MRRMDESKGEGESRKKGCDIIIELKKRSKSPDAGEGRFSLHLTKINSEEEGKEKEGRRIEKIGLGSFCSKPTKIMSQRAKKEQMKTNKERRRAVGV